MTQLLISHSALYFPSPFFSCFLGFYIVRTCNFPYYYFTLIPILVFAWDILLNILNDDIKYFAKVSLFISYLDDGLPLVNYSWRAWDVELLEFFLKAWYLKGHFGHIKYPFPEFLKYNVLLFTCFVIFGKPIASIIFLSL